MINKEISYKQSHTEFGKGIAYDKNYSILPWRKYLWSQEQFVLDNFFTNYLGNRKIKLLDFACGTGRITSFLESRVEKSIAVDVSKSMLDEARKKVKRSELIEADLTVKNVLRGQTFDLITAFRFFLNAEPELRFEVMKVLVSLLAEDGYLVFNNHRNKTAPLIWSRYLLSKIRNKELHCMTMSETRSLAWKSGLEIIRIYPIGLLPLPFVKLPEKWNHKLDSMAMRLKFAGVFSESPIIVCRRRSLT
jgi:SAM-dependent methyltransferase